VDEDEYHVTVIVIPVDRSDSSDPIHAVMELMERVCELTWIARSESVRSIS